MAELGVDRDRDRVRRVAERAAVTLGLVRDGDLEAAEIDVGRQPVGPVIPGGGDLLERHRALRPDHLAVLEAGGRHGALHQVRADRDEARDQGLAAFTDRAARHHDRARRIRAGRERRQAGVTVHDLDALDVDAEHLVGDLGPWS